MSNNTEQTHTHGIRAIQVKNIDELMEKLSELHATHHSENTSENNNETSSHENQEGLKSLTDFMEAVSGNKPSPKSPQEKEFMQLVKFASEWIKNNHADAVAESNLMTRLNTLLNDDSNGPWRAANALHAAAMFIKRSEGSTVADRMQVGRYVRVLVDTGLSLAERTSFTDDVRDALQVLIPLVNLRQLKGTWETVTEYLFREIRQAPSSSEPYHYLANILLSIAPTPDNTDSKFFQGDLSNALAPFVTNTFDVLGSFVDWTNPLTIEADGRVSLAHATSHFLQGLTVRMTLNTSERIATLNYVTRLINEKSGSWIKPFTSRIIDLIYSLRKYFDTSETCIVKFISLSMNL